jgi:hypothetical protein
MGEVSVTTVDRVNELYRDLSTLFSNSIEKAIEMGDVLLEAKNSLDHGQFKPWVEENFIFSYRTANKWMNLALNKKDVRKLIKGNKVLSLTDAYGVGVANTVTPKAESGAGTAPARKGISKRDLDMASALWDQPSSVPLERYQVLAQGGTVLMKKKDVKGNPIMVCTVTADPIPGCEEAYAQLNKGLQILFEQYYAVIEQIEAGTGPAPEQPKRGKLRTVSEGADDGDSE